MADEQLKRDSVLNYTPTSDPVDEYFESFPPGYRFRPYDEELITQYLIKKIHKKPLPRNKMKQVDFYSHNPETLAEKHSPYGEMEWYFFTHRDRKYPNGDRPKRDAGDGYWKATGIDKKIYKDNRVDIKNEIGKRKGLVFYKGKPPTGKKTDWIMHEYKAKGTGSDSNTTGQKNRTMRLDDVVLCRLYKKPAEKKKKSGRKQDNDVLDPDEQHCHNDNGNQIHEMTDFTGELPHEGPSSRLLRQPNPECAYGYGGSNMMISPGFRNCLPLDSHNYGFSFPPNISEGRHTPHHENDALIDENFPSFHPQPESQVLHPSPYDLMSLSRQDALTQDLSGVSPRYRNGYSRNSMMVNGGYPQHSFPAPTPYILRPVPAPPLPQYVIRSAPAQHGLHNDSKPGHIDSKK